MRLRQRLRRLATEFPQTMAALLVAILVEVGLRAVHLDRLAGWLGVPLATTEAAAVDEPLRSLPPWARARVRATRRVMRHWPFGDTCLRQALVSGGLLRRLRPTLRVGVARIDGEVRAHAWLVIRGAILDPLGAASSYQPLSRPDGGRR
jgi:hypothetical protein